MRALNNFIVAAKRDNTRVYRILRAVVRGYRNFRMPIPALFNPVLGLLFALQFNVVKSLRRLASVFLFEPLFRGRCERAGRRLLVSKMPFVTGPAKLIFGDDVNLFGKLDVQSGHILENPTLLVHNRVDLGHNVSITLNQLIEIEDDVNVASGVRFMDSDSHPRDVNERIADKAPRPEEIRPVKICRGAWIGQSAFIMKGVTVGEGAIVGAASVVVTDVPPYTVVMGNPARVVIKLNERMPGSTVPVSIAQTLPARQ